MVVKLENREMISFHTRILPIGDRVPDSLRTWMGPFRQLFTAPVWEHALVLLMGAMLAPGKRTVSSALRIPVVYSSPVGP